MKKVAIVAILSSVVLWGDLFQLKGTGNGLYWYDNDDAKNTVKTWEEAIQYCEEYSGGGQAWRLPTINELASIIDDTKHSPALNPSISRAYEESVFYWSSTSVNWSLDKARGIDFEYGYTDKKAKSETGHVRCVTGSATNYDDKAGRCCLKCDPLFTKADFESASNHEITYDSTSKTGYELIYKAGQDGDGVVTITLDNEQRNVKIFKNGFEEESNKNIPIYSGDIIVLLYGDRAASSASTITVKYDPPVEL